MANLLTAIGRAQPVTQFIDTALKVQGGMNQADLAAQQKQLNEMKLREEERKNEWLDVTEIKGRMEKGGYGGAADLAIEHAISTGTHQEVQDPLGNKRVMVRRRDIDTGLDAVGKNAQAQPVLLARREQWLSEQIDKVKMGDPKSEEQAKAWAEERRMIRNKLYGLEKGEADKVQGIDPEKDVWKGGVKIASGIPKPPTEPRDAINDFSVFYRGQKEQNPNITEAQISEVWHDLKTKEAKAIGESRIPGYTAAPAGLPPGYAFNRRTGNYEWRGNGPAPGTDLASVATDYSANKKSLDTQVKIRDSMQSYVQNMKEQANRLKSIAGEVTRLDTRLLNVPIRKWGMSVRGTAAEAKVNMYLTEISSEIGKLATGSTASVQELSQSAREKWEKIHDPNMSIKEMIKLLEETQKAGDLRIKSVNDVVRGIENRIGRGQGGNAQTADPYGIR